jgi:hypothetical protein
MFADLIRENKLGSLVSTENHELNPNSGQFVKVWVWGIDHEALNKWYSANGAKEKEKSWAQKPMSAVLGAVEYVGSLCGSPQQGSEIIAGSVGNVPSSNSASTTRASSPRSR